MLVMGEIRLHQRRWNMFPLQHAPVSKIAKDSQKEYVHNYFPRLTFLMKYKRETSQAGKVKVTAGVELQEGVCADQVQGKDIGPSTVHTKPEQSITLVLGTQE